MKRIQTVILGGLFVLGACATGPRADDSAKTLRLPAVREEILQMVKEDQEARSAGIRSGFKDPAIIEQMGRIDAKNTARLKSWVAEHGWLGKSLVGEDGASAAWLLVQHADKDPAFQKACLEKMKEGLQHGEVSGKNVAYLEDRVAVAENRKQTYGTQFQGTCENLAPRPIEDERGVDERRRSVGLASMAEYKKQMEKAYHCAPQSE